jgi:hypothetical protein
VLLAIDLDVAGEVVAEEWVLVGALFLDDLVEHVRDEVLAGERERGRLAVQRPVSEERVDP